MIIAVTDRRISAAPDPMEQLERIADAGPDMIILREKDLTEPEYGRMAEECARLCRGRDVRLCVNSFTGVAERLGLEDVNIPYGSLMGLGDIRSRNVWVSVHTKEEAVEAERLGATHLIYGNVFGTSCKPGLRGKGLEALRDVCGSVGIPVFAIGGMDASNSRPAIDSGCRGVCIRSGLMAAEEPSKVIASVRDAMHP